jgi:hypothetical protein
MAPAAASSAPAQNRHAAEADPKPDPPVEVLEEGVFRAARFGVGARLPDADGQLRPVSELLDDALALGHAHELHCADELAADAFACRPVTGSTRNNSSSTPTENGSPEPNVLPISSSELTSGAVPSGCWTKLHQAPN